MQILLAIGLLLIVVIAFFAFRVAKLITRINPVPEGERARKQNRVNAMLWPVVFVLGMGAIIASSVVAAGYFLPEPASVHGVEIDNLFWITLGILCAVFFATHVPLFWFPYKYQFKEGRRASFYPDNNKLEVIWTIVPALVLTLLVFSGWKVWRDITSEAPEEAVVVEIVGRQFNWMVRYPGTQHQVIGTQRPELGAYNYQLINVDNEYGIDLSDQNSFDDFMPGEIHLPKGKPVLLTIRGRDVLHSVFMPHFRLKMDAMPGMPTKFWFVPTKTTEEMRADLDNPGFNYELACTELCGRGHFAMRTIVVVEEEDDFNRWMAQQKPWLATRRDLLQLVPENLRGKALQVIGPEPASAQRTDTLPATPPEAAAFTARKP